jgi:ParB family chromosome partitioning protein
MEENNNKGKAHVSYNSGNNEWYTPQYIIDVARKTMGGIDLDPASSEIANRTVQATTFYTKEVKGLIQPWFGNVWLNPPYSKDLIGKFAMAIKDRRMEYDQAIILVNNATETLWYQDMASVASAICYVEKRIKFLDINGKPGSPLQGQVILYVGSYPSRFIENFLRFGVCQVKYNVKTKFTRLLGSHYKYIRGKCYLIMPDKSCYPLGS